MYELFAKVAIPALVVIVFGLARRYVATSVLTMPPPPMEELERRFSLTQWVVGAGMLGFGFLIFITVHQVLVTANRHVASLDGPAKFVLFPQDAIWFFLPGFAALTLPWELTLWVWSAFGSKTLALQYEYWSNTKTGFNSTRILRIMTAVIVLTVAVLTALALPEHDSVQENAIRSRRYGFTGTKIFDYSQAKTLAVIDGFRDRDGRLHRRAGCVLYFSAGRKWSSAEIGDFEPYVDSSLLAFLKSKTGLQAKHAETEAEIGDIY